MRPWKFESAYISNAAFDGAGAAAKTVAPIHAATPPTIFLLTGMAKAPILDRPLLCGV
ncbi:hypothetical protein [Cutibacterium namnetense]|uniref:hypothetical protein n=1 Tax=Cutibacterium namnetense TaxID=1574624 RepID=UPI001F2807D1|nr:hypothetical protein [Cutibacterium namnetense]